MPNVLEVQPRDNSLIVFDGTILEVFAGGVQIRIHARGLEGIEITEGFGRSLMIKNRFGPDAGVAYDKDRLPELRRFIDQVLAAVPR